MVKNAMTQDRRRQHASESVSLGHPDRLTDWWASAILTEVLKQDPNARVALEMLTIGSGVVVSGEVTTSIESKQLDRMITSTVRRVLGNCGYNKASLGVQVSQYKVDVRLDRQSPDIAQGVNVGGAGDQGVMYGYASCEDPVTLMPMTHVLARELLRKLDEVRRESIIAGLRPDGKSEVVIENDEEGMPSKVKRIAMAVQHDPCWSQEDLEPEVRSKVVQPTLRRYPTLDTSELQLTINGTGKFVEGGPGADKGVVGRKTQVESYSSRALHGGGALCGKDPTKVDMSAPMFLRFVAKNIVAAGLARRCTVGTAYVIGLEEPCLFEVDTHGTHIGDDVNIELDIARVIRELASPRPGKIIERFRLREIDHEALVRYYGPFGHSHKDTRNLTLFPWEGLDLVEELQQRFSTTVATAS